MAQPGPDPAVGPPTAAAVSPALRAKRSMSIGLVLLVGGAVVTAVTCAGMVAVTDAHFPLVRLVGLLLILLAVVAVVAAVRGLVTLVQGIIGYARAPKP